VRPDLIDGALTKPTGDAPWVHEQGGNQTSIWSSVFTSGDRASAERGDGWQGQTNGMALSGCARRIRIASPCSQGHPLRSWPCHPPTLVPRTWLLKIRLI